MCLENNEYTSRRNALTVLKRLIPVFPLADQHALLLRKSLEKVCGSWGAGSGLRALLEPGEGGAEAWVM